VTGEWGGNASFQGQSIIIRLPDFDARRTGDGIQYEETFFHLLIKWKLQAG
jgi:hypothetical protein